MVVIERRVDPTDGQQQTWAQFRQKNEKKHNLPIASPSPGWHLEHYWTEKCEIVTEENCSEENRTDVFLVQNKNKTPKNLTAYLKTANTTHRTGKVEIAKAKVQEVSGKVASMVCTPKVKEVACEIESAVCTPKVKEVKDKASMICSDTVLPKLKEAGGTAAVTCTDTVVPKLKEMMDKLQDMLLPSVTSAKAKTLLRDPIKVESALKATKAQETAKAILLQDSSKVEAAIGISTQNGTDTVVPKLKDMKGKAAAIYADSVAPKLKEVAAKVKEVSGKASWAVCNPDTCFPPVKDHESPLDKLDEKMQGA